MVRRADPRPAPDGPSLIPVRVVRTSRISQRYSALTRNRTRLRRRRRGIPDSTCDPSRACASGGGTTFFRIFLAIRHSAPRRAWRRRQLSAVCEREQGDRRARAGERWRRLRIPRRVREPVASGTMPKGLRARAPTARSGQVLSYRCSSRTVLQRDPRRRCSRSRANAAARGHLVGDADDSASRAVTVFSALTLAIPHIVWACALAVVRSDGDRPW